MPVGIFSKKSSALPDNEERSPHQRNVTFQSKSKQSNFTFKSTMTTSLDGEDKRVLDEELSMDVESEASMGTHARRLFDMHLTWRKSQAVPRNVHSSRVSELVQKPAFKFFINLMILGSAIQMGMAADMSGGDWDQVWDVCEFVFTTVFASEMLLKLVALGLTYFFDGWNCLDFFVAWSSIIDVWIIPSILDEKEDAPQILKLFRLCRLLRIVKMLRVVPELMLVVEGIMASLRSMFWVFLLLAVILYTVGIYCVEAIGSKGAGYKGWDNDLVIEETVIDPFNNFMYFGTITRSMVSLFGLVLLSEWSPVVRPVWEQQPAIVIIFIGLVILTTFGVLNVIIGVVVERTTAAMNQVREKDVAKKKREQTKAFQLISSLMFDLDTDKDKRVSKQEMELGADNDTLHELLQRVDFPHGFTYGEFHAMLDQDGSGYLSRSEFINGMLRLVYNDQFQRDCMFQLTMGQIKANQCRLHRETKTYIQQLYGGIKKEIENLRTDLDLPKRSRQRKRTSPAGGEQGERKEGGLDVSKSKNPSEVGGASLGLKSLFPAADYTSSDSTKQIQCPDRGRSPTKDGFAGGLRNSQSALTGTEVNEVSNVWEPLQQPDSDANVCLDWTPASLPTAATLPTPVSLPTLPDLNEDEDAEQGSDPPDPNEDEDSDDVDPRTAKNLGLPDGVVRERSLVMSDSRAPDQGCGGQLLYSCIGRGGPREGYVDIDANASELGHAENEGRSSTNVSI